jgi:hypothetical protein
MIDAHAHALEAFNRATHSDALPEMQLEPAETEQPVHPMEGAFPIRWAVPLAFALGVILTVVWSNAI